MLLLLFFFVNMKINAQYYYTVTYYLKNIYMHVHVTQLTIIYCTWFLDNYDAINYY